ncbi:hypothetical protein QBC38DRAFT_493229 [Podospora fimiseda]|uniref:Uncharacterized protein n=1 Tax=Podospora fimiseda TaxID=252190 RepID=A0AAN6YLS6_9PEZI|nr:hypothetical protein QBC38DRAFT_493229 [Podospora fimiseda]
MYSTFNPSATTIRCFTHNELPVTPANNFQDFKTTNDKFQHTHLSPHDRFTERSPQQETYLPSPQSSTSIYTPDEQLLGENQQSESDDKPYQIGISSEAPAELENRQYQSLPPTPSGSRPTKVNDIITVDTHTSSSISSAPLNDTITVDALTSSSSRPVPLNDSITDTVATLQEPRKCGKRKTYASGHYSNLQKGKQVKFTNPLPPPKHTEFIKVLHMVTWKVP